MTQEVIVALMMNDCHLARQILSILDELKDVRGIENYNAGATAAETSPHIVILHNQPESADIFDEVSAIHKALPQAYIFVISHDKSPEHIVEVMKAGATEFFTNPLDVQKLKNALEKVKLKIINATKTAKGTLYSFISSKGGLGTTAVSVNTATALAMHSKGSVALLDMSLQSGDSSVYLDTLPHTTLVDVCKNFHRLDFSFLKSAMLKHSTGLNYLAAPVAPEDSVRIHGEQVKKVLELAKDIFDHVIVDCTSMLVDECSLEAFNASDRIFVVTDLSVPAVRNAARLIQLIQKLEIDPQKIEIVVNRFIKGGVPSVDEIERSLKKRIFWLFPNDFDDIIASINTGIPIVKGKPETAFAKNVMDFIEKLKNPAAFQHYRGAKGFLGKAI